MSFYGISGALYAGREEDISGDATVHILLVSNVCIVKFMFTKRRIVVIIGIIVAILITFYTGVFGIVGIA